MGDLINRSSLIEEIWGLYNSRYNNASIFDEDETKLINKVLGEVQQLIEEQPKIGEWISVSVNKPQRQFSNNTIIKFYQVSTKRGNVRFGFRNEDGKWLNEHGNIIPNVIAWMPLPEPYKE